MTPATLHRDDVDALSMFDLFTGEGDEGGELQSDEAVVVLFAGFGGVEQAIVDVFGRDADEAVNHSAPALAVHAANYPRTNRHHSDIWEVDPVDVAKGRKIGLLWASPDCTHFSKAKGAKPVSRRRRALAHVVVRYAKTVRPRVIGLENVEEFQTWGPVSRKTGRPDPLRRGRSFRTWRRQLERLGYVIEWRMLRGCDFGAPTTRRRLFLFARCDGRPIRWPRPTHGPGRAHPYRTAADCIDWSIPCPSIFLTTEEGKALGVKRPLADKTLRRIARGIRRYVIDAVDPYIVDVQYRGPVHGVTTIAPTLVQTGYGERKGQAPRSLDLHAPLGTVVGCGQKHALVTAFIAKHYGDRGQRPGTAMTEPLSTVTTSDHNALVTAMVIPIDHASSGDAGARPAGEPLSTVTTEARHALVTAFLVKFYSNGGQWSSLDNPAPTVMTKDRLALVMVRGAEVAIYDIGMRMLTPRELARAQGFPDSFILDATYVDPKTKRIKRVTKGEQVQMVGNSVNWQVVAALLRANLGTRERAKVAA